MAALQLFLAPLLAGVFTLWAAWLALAAESEAELPRLFAARMDAGSGRSAWSAACTSRTSRWWCSPGAMAGGAVAWWAYPPVTGLARLARGSGPGVGGGRPAAAAGRRRSRRSWRGPSSASRSGRSSRSSRSSAWWPGRTRKVRANFGGKDGSGHLERDMLRRCLLARRDDRGRGDDAAHRHHRGGCVDGAGPGARHCCGARSTPGSSSTTDIPTTSPASSTPRTC